LLNEIRRELGNSTKVLAPSRTAKEDSNSLQTAVKEKQEKVERFKSEFAKTALAEGQIVSTRPQPTAAPQPQTAQTSNVVYAMSGLRMQDSSILQADVKESREKVERLKAEVAAEDQVSKVLAEADTGGREFKNITLDIEKTIQVHRTHDLFNVHAFPSQSQTHFTLQSIHLFPFSPFLLVHLLKYTLVRADERRNCRLQYPWKQLYLFLTLTQR
jgi:hypothetical protein